MEKPPEKILMVDDDRNLLDSFRRQFRKSLHFETATSGADGVQACAQDWIGGNHDVVFISAMSFRRFCGIAAASSFRRRDCDFRRTGL